MEKSNLKTEIKYLIECPYCGEYDHNVTHLMKKNTTWGPWYCDECGKSIKGEIKDGVVFHEKTETFMKKSLTALELPVQTDPIFLIVEDSWLDGDKNDSGIKYFYEEGTCPTNFLKRSVELIFNGESDPHGLFEYMKSVEAPKEDTINYSFDDWMKLFNFSKILR